MLSVKECLSFGWTTFKKRAWFFVGVAVLLFVIQSVISAIQNAVPDVLGFVVSLVGSTLLYAGIMNFFLKAHEDVTSVHYKDLWHPKPFLNYLGLSILLMIIVGIGLVLLIIPGVILSLMFFAAGYLVVDRGMTPIKALKESMRITKGNLLKLLLFGFTVLVLSIIGMLPLFLGLLVVVPVAGLAGVHAYRTLAHTAGELVPVVK